MQLSNLAHPLRCGADTEPIVMSVAVNPVTAPVRRAIPKSASRIPRRARRWLGCGGLPVFVANPRWQCHYQSVISAGESPRAVVLDARSRRAFRGAPRELPRIDLAHWVEVSDRARHEAVPLVIAGAVANSIAVRKWSPRGLATRFDTTVPAALDLPGGRSPYMDAQAAHSAQIPFSELIDRIERGESCYLAQASLERFEGLEGDLDLSALTAVPRYGVNLWVGGQTRSGLHFDSADNVLVQIYGRKCAILVAPKHVRALRVVRDVPSKSSLSPDEIESDRDGPRVGSSDGARLWTRATLSTYRGDGGIIWPAPARRFLSTIGMVTTSRPRIK